MLTLLRKLFSRLLWKPAFGTLAAVGVTAVLALYLYVHDADFETSLDALEKLVEKMENGDMRQEESLKA